MPIMALAAIMTAGISWIFDVARIMKATNVTATEMSSVIFRPYFCRTNPAIRAEKIAPKGTALAGKKKLEMNEKKRKKNVAEIFKIEETHRGKMGGGIKQDPKENYQRTCQ